MWIPIALVVGLLVATAIIAPWADNLGKKLGKKRVSWFGLRPRTTATIATVGSSWLIMIFTLAVLLAVVTPLRNALFHYQSEREQAESRLEIAKHQESIAVGDKNAALDDLKKARQAVFGFREEAQQARDEAKKANNETRNALNNLQNARRGEQNARRGAQGALATARSAQTNARKAQNAASLAVAQQRVAQEELRGTQRSLQIAKTSLDFAEKRLKTAQGRLRAADLQLINAGRQIVSVGREAVQVQKQAQRDVAEIQGQVRIAKKEVDQLQTQKADLQAQVNGLVELANTYDNISKQLAFGNISLAVDQTLAERRFDATRSPDDIARELRFLITTASEAAREILHNKKLEFMVGAAIADKSGTPIDLNEEQAITLYSNALSSANQTVSARLVSGFNYPSDTTLVVARFVFVPIRTIYIARQDIAQATIDTNKSESAIWRQLQDLVDTARYNAVKLGASPPLSPETQNFFDGDTGQKLFDTLREVQKYDHPVQVRVVAARDLDSAEPLQIRFIVGDET
ncbi:hypothetical protein IAD21_01510 [Abditibacteriota bacterium]|nr:hypothetical protein IAD21_01510 [Abditibacteriota bacterium]